MLSFEKNDKIFFVTRRTLRVFAGAWFFVCLLVVLVLLPQRGLAQNGADDIKNDLRSQLEEVQRKIDEYENSIQEALKQKKSLAREIGILDNEIEQQRLKIKRINLDLREVENEIGDTQAEIDRLEVRLKERKALLNSAIQKLNEYDQVSWVSILLRSENLSDFFNQVRYLQNIRDEINNFSANIDETRANLEERKEELENKKMDIVRLKGLGNLEQVSMEQKRKDKANLLAKTKGDEKSFNDALKKSKKDIQLIKQQLFTLESVGVSMSFEEAVNRAVFAGQKTGVRPAFILAIFQVESKLGTYIGGGSWKVDMKPQERPLFLQITGKLGLDPDTMPVSKKPWYGWGGAMGAAQFIPSTWLAYESQIISLTGHNPPSPWNIEDAFIASALKLSSTGANKQTYESEHTAAAKYLAGNNYKKKVARQYADTVMDWAAYYQGQIDAINEVGSVRSPAI